MNDYRGISDLSIFADLSSPCISCHIRLVEGESGKEYRTTFDEMTACMLDDYQDDYTIRL